MSYAEKLKIKVEEIISSISELKGEKITNNYGQKFPISQVIKTDLDFYKVIKEIPELVYFLTESTIEDYYEEIKTLFNPKTIGEYLTAKKVPIASKLEANQVIEYVKKLTPVTDLEDAKDVVLFDSENRKVTSYSFEHWVTYNMIPAKEVKAHISPAIFTFDPWNLEAIYVKEVYGVPTPHVNFYVPPRWRYKEVTVELPPLINEFMTHLFPSEEVRKYIFHWLYNLIVKRNQTYLCLIGARGVGKNIFAEELCGALVGLDHFEKVGDSLLEDKFNAPLKNKRLIILDEVDVDEDRKVNRLKAFGNDMIPIESKGVDSKKERNFNSFIIATNSLDGMHFGPEERRFSIPEISENKLDKIWSVEKINALVKELRNPDSDMVAQFGHWVLGNGEIKGKDEFYCYKGAYFFEVLRISMYDWQKFIVDEVTSKKKKVYWVKAIAKLHADAIKEVSPDFKGRVMFPRADSSKLVTFLKNYLHEGNDRIGTLAKTYNSEKGREEWAIIPSEKFTPEHDFEEITGLSLNNTLDV